MIVADAFHKFYRCDVCSELYVALDDQCIIIRNGLQCLGRLWFVCGTLDAAIRSAMALGGWDAALAVSASWGGR